MIIIKGNWMSRLFNKSGALLILLLLSLNTGAGELNDSKKLNGIQVESLPGIAAEDPLKGIIFRNLKGNLIDLGELRGKVVFINFWASWCLPCVAEFPSLKKLYQLYGDDAEVVFLFVDADSDLEKAAQFMKRRKYGLPVYAVEGSIPDQLFSGQLPTTVVLDKKGRISYREIGPANYGSRKFIAFIGDLKSAK